jgi:hypothetical protein
MAEGFRLTRWLMGLTSKITRDDRRSDYAAPGNGDCLGCSPRFAFFTYLARVNGWSVATNRRPLSVFAAVCLMGLWLAGCGGKPFDVKPQVSLPAIADAPLGEMQGIRIQAAAVRDEDYLISTYDANLILAGILPLNVAITNGTSQPLDLHQARFEVRTMDGHSYKSAEVQRAFKRLIKYYQISTYSKPAYKKSQEDFSTYALDTTKPLAMGESRQGMLFFIVPDGVAQASGLKLIGRRLEAANSKSVIELQLK